METEHPSSTQCSDNKDISIIDVRLSDVVRVNSVDVNINANRKRTVKRCKVCRRKFRNHELYIEHLKLHKVTRRLSKFQRKVNKTSKKDLLYQCRICDTKHIGFVQCFEHQRLHEQHSKYFNKLFNSSDLVSENNRYHILNSDSQNEQPAEVIIATSEDVELLQQQQLDGNAIINVITNISDNESHVDVSTAKIQSSDVHPREVINIVGDVHTHNGVDVVHTCDDVGIMHIHEEDVDHTHNEVDSDNIHTHKELVVSHHENISNHIPIPFSTPEVSPSPSCKLVDSSHGMQIDIPHQVKAIYLNSAGSDLGDVLKKLEELSKKVDFIIKHMNDPANSVSSHIPVETDRVDVHEDHEKELENEDGGGSVILEGFPPSYSIIQAAKEQQQQEYYAATIAHRQGQVFKPNEGHVLSVSPSEMKVFPKKPLEMWVPGQQYLASLSSLPGNQEEESPGNISSAPSLISKHVIEKVFVESRSRANFAKNLCFAIFSHEERQGKNCTGRVFGKAQHKGQLDPVKVQAIKDITFRKYPCNPCLVDITWRKECVTAIDSGLRNENRTAKSQTPILIHQSTSSTSS